MVSRRQLLRSSGLTLAGAGLHRELSHPDMAAAMQDSDSTPISRDERFDHDFDVRLFGAVPGSGDSTEAIQAAADAMLKADNGGYLYFGGGDYTIDGPITLKAPNGTDLVGFGARGDGPGCRLIQKAENAPHFALDGSNLHSLSFTEFHATWSSGPSSDHADRNMIRTTGSGNWYNSVLRSLTVSNGHYVVRADSSMSVWGILFEAMRVSNMSGGFTSLTSSNGQPNNSFQHIYIGAQVMEGPIFNHNAMNASMDAIEINQASLGAQLLRDNGGGNYAIGLFGCEGGTWSTDRRHLLEVNDTTVEAVHIFLTGTATERTNIFRTAGRGHVHVTFFINAITPSDAGRLYIGEVGGENLEDPNAWRGQIVFDRIRAMTEPVAWSQDGNVLALTSIEDTHSADAVMVTEWNDPVRVSFRPDADVTIGASDTRTNIVQTDVTEDRTFTLPPGALLFSGRGFTFVKTTATDGKIDIADARGEVIATLPADSAGRVTVVWNRSLANGPGYDAWTLVENATW